MESERRQEEEEEEEDDDDNNGAGSKCQKGMRAKDHSVDASNRALSRKSATDSGYSDDD